MTLARGFIKPAQGLDITFGNADTGFEQQAQIILGDGVVLRCRLEEPGGGFLGILVGALAAQIHITKIGLGPGKALLG